LANGLMKFLVCALQCDPGIHLILMAEEDRPYSVEART
jgi:hypothetical protein